MNRQPAYTVKGAALYLGVCTFLIAIGGTVLYVSGEEVLRCERGAADDAVCRISRRVGPVIVRNVDLGSVTGADLVEEGGGTRSYRPSENRQPQSLSPSYALHYRSAQGPVSSRGVDERECLVAIRSALASFVADPHQRSLEQLIPARSAKIAWSVFALGTFLAMMWMLGFLFPSLRSEV
jgi:hypothetical protein